MPQDTTWTEQYIDSDGPEPRIITVYNRRVHNMVVKTAVSDRDDYEIVLEPEAPILTNQGDI